MLTRLVLTVLHQNPPPLKPDGAKEAKSPNASPEDVGIVAISVPTPDAGDRPVTAAEDELEGAGDRDDGMAEFDKELPDGDTVDIRFGD